MIITGKKFSKPDMSRVINGDVQLSTGPERAPRFRLDHLLVEIHPEFNRSTLQNFIKSGYVTVDEKEIKKPNFMVEITEVKLDGLKPEEMLKKAASNEAVKSRISMTVPERITPPEIKDKIIYEDENVLVINKPAGLLSMAKGEFTDEPTLEDYGLLVHRLDRDTSGVVILAKNPAVQSMLRRQFQERKTHKTYYAIIEGAPKLDEAMIDLPIERNLKHPTTFQVGPNGKASQTYYKILQKSDKYSLVELKPVTGRTHQLRVHLKYLGTPILGDPVYGTTKKKSEERIRLYLHAHSLEITIPGKEEGLRKTFEAPLPDEFKKVL